MEDAGRLPRKLAAILYADVAGYSRLTGEDEDATHRRLSRYLDLIATTVGQHRGRVMHYAGDAVLARFEAVVDALGCAVHVQRELEARNADLSEERKVQFRIGVNLGDVIEDRGDIYGDGVNVAARLEALAEPGGICVSGTVFDAIGTRLPLDFDSLGEQRVKNIATPVRVFRARLRAGEALPGPGAPRRSRYRSRALAAAAISAVLVVAAGVLAWLQPWAPEFEPAAVERMAYPLPDKPSVAVLPFANASGNPEDDVFADGMTDDLITDLSKISGLFVIARNSSFAYKGESSDPRRVSRELGVKYLLEGSMRRVGEQVRVNAQLVDAATGNHLWAERYDGTLDDIFAFQSEVTTAIISALAVRLTESEVARVAKHETEDPQAYLAFVRGWQRYRQRSPESYATALSEFESATHRDPDFARAHAALASTYWESWERWWHKTLGIAERDELLELAKHHLALAEKEPNSLTHQVLSEMRRQEDRIDDMVAEAQRSLELDPNDPDGHIAMAFGLIFAGRPEEATRHVEHAMRLDPHHPPFYLYVLALAHLGLERYATAASLAQQALDANPKNVTPVQVLASAYGHLGRAEEAQDAIIAFDRNLSTRWTRHFYRYKHPEDAERLIAGLRKAGVPELAEGVPPPPEE